MAKLTPSWTPTAHKSICCIFGQLWVQAVIWVYMFYFWLKLSVFFSIVCFSAIFQFYAIAAAAFYDLICIYKILIIRRETENFCIYTLSSGFFGNPCRSTSYHTTLSPCFLCHSDNFMRGMLGKLCPSTSISPILFFIATLILCILSLYLSYVAGISTSCAVSSPASLAAGRSVSCTLSRNTTVSATPLTMRPSSNSMSATV